MKRALAILTLLCIGLILQLPARAADEQSSAKEVAAAPQKEESSAAEVPAAADESEGEQTSDEEMPAEEFGEEYSDEPLGQSTIFIYQDGDLVGYSVGEDFEFYEVDDKDIMEGNAELLAELTGYGNNEVSLGASAANSGEHTFNAEQGGAHPEGLYAHNLMWHDMLSPGDWQEFYGDWTSAKTYNAAYDYSTDRGNLDASFFNLGGYSYGVTTNENQDAQFFGAQHKSRRQGKVVWRQGSAEGGVWTIEGTAYKVNTEGALAGTSDVDLQRLDAKFRMVECGLVLKGGAYYGQYKSDYISADNSFIGGKVDGEYCLAPDLRLNAKLGMTSTNADKQDGNFSQADLGAGLSWDLSDDVTLVGEARTYTESNDVAANTHLTGFDDLSARMDMHPSADTSFSLGWRRRDVDLERLKFGNTDVGLLALETENPPTRADLAPYREDNSSQSDRIDMSGQWRLSDRFYLGANWEREEFDSLPIAENIFNADPQAPYFGDSRHSSSIHMSYDTGCGGNFTLRGDEWSRSNSAREASFDSRRIALGYNAPLTSCTRWGAEVSHSKTNLDLTGDTQDWDANSWNYGLNLSGYECWADYRISYNHQSSEGYSGGEYDSVGLEMNLKQSPIYLSGWWRERADAMGGFANYDDTGVSVGYRIEL